MKLIPSLEVWETLAESFWSDQSQFSCFNVPHSHTTNTGRSVQHPRPWTCRCMGTFWWPERQGMVNVAMPGTNWPYQETYSCDHLWMVDFLAMVVSLEGILNSEMGRRETQSIFNKIWTDDSSHLKICIQKAWRKHQGCKNHHLMTLGLGLVKGLTLWQVPHRRYKYIFQWHLHQNTVLFLVFRARNGSCFLALLHCRWGQSLQSDAISFTAATGCWSGQDCAWWEIQRFLDEQSIWIKLFLPLFWDIRLHLDNGRCRGVIV